MMKKVILLSILLLMPFSLYAFGNIKCWVNEDNIRSCGNYIPQKYAQEGYAEYDPKTGYKIHDIAPAPTPEEIAEKENQKREKRKQEAQEKKDIQFLDIFQSKRDIERARKAIHRSIDGQIQSITTIFDGLKGNLKDLKASYEKTKVAKEVVNKPKALIKFKEAIASVKQRLINTEETLKQMQAKRVSTDKEYDGYIQRFLNIKARQKQQQLLQDQIF